MKQTDQKSIASMVFHGYMMRDSDIQNEIFRSQYERIMQSNGFYLVADADATENDWKNNEYGVYVSVSMDLLVFVDKKDAVIFANNHERVLKDGTPMIKCVNKDTLCNLVNMYQKKGIIRNVKIYIVRPIFINIPLENFQNNKKEQADKLMNGEAVDFVSEECPEKLKMLEFIIQILNTSEREKRRRMDQGDVCGNVHKVVERLIHLNHIDSNELEKKLELPSGFLIDFCNNQMSADIGKSALLRILGYFGLQQYIYHYKKYCKALMEEMKQEGKIDVEEIKPATVSSSNRFVLKSVERITYGQIRAFVYKMVFESNGNTITTLRSTCWDFVEGKEYELVGTKVTTKIPMNKAAEMTSALLDREDAKRGGRKQERTPEEKDQDTIIRYLKEKTGCSAQDAMKKACQLRDSDIIHAFAYFIEKGNHLKNKSLKVCDYTAGRLIQELKYEPYEAYKILADLRYKPSETKQLLKYRETAPQYQGQNQQ